MSFPDVILLVSKSTGVLVWCPIESMCIGIVSDNACDTAIEHQYWRNIVSNTIFYVMCVTPTLVFLSELVFNLLDMIGESIWHEEMSSLELVFELLLSVVRMGYQFLTNFW